MSKKLLLKLNIRNVELKCEIRNNWNMWQTISDVAVEVAKIIWNQESQASIWNE